MKGIRDRTYYSVVVGIGLTLFLLVGTLANDDWSACLPFCQCKWVSGRKTADCSNTSVNTIPRGLHPDIQALILSHGHISSLPSQAFGHVGLLNLQRIIMRSSNIQEVHKDAFKGLGLVFDLDLRDNRIQVLHKDIFKDNEKLRMVYLSGNHIKRLDDGLFSNLIQLQHVDFENCLISSVGQRVFHNVSNLKTINLQGNQLSHVNLNTFAELSLNQLILGGNPWRCDCHLRKFRIWFVNKGWANQVTCSEPANLKDLAWTNSDPDLFACKPEILWYPSDPVVAGLDEEVTLSCKVSGDPEPDTRWLFNSRLIGNNSYGPYSNEKRYVFRESGGLVRWFNLTIEKIRPQDQGEFSCVAENYGGVEGRNMTLTIGSIFGPSNKASEFWMILLSILIAALLALVILMLMCFGFCFGWKCCKRGRETDSVVKLSASSKKNNSSSNHVITSNGDLSNHRSIDKEGADQQKMLLASNVNPVQKPPRKYDSPTFSRRKATELNEINKHLLDDTNYGRHSELGDADCRSTDSGGRQSSQHSQEALLPHEGSRPSTIVAPTAHRGPPDLIAFPRNARFLTASPASSTDTSADISYQRMFNVRSRSPCQSPIYHGMPYGTLPRSSQFANTPGRPVISQRSGYVTIPRRPRVPSWASAPTPTLMEDPFGPFSEPLYDSLGPRTTADGSILSLPRASNGSAKSRSSVASSTPLHYTTLPHPQRLYRTLEPLNGNMEPKRSPITVELTNRNIEEPLEDCDPGPLPDFTKKMSTPPKTLPRPMPPMELRRVKTPPTVEPRKISPPTISRLSPVVTDLDSSHRIKPPRNSPETGVLRSNNNSNSKEKLHSTSLDGATSFATSSPNVPGTSTPQSNGKPKIPPKPLPKPSKSILCGPLFEDEGEDGTEV